MIQKEIDFTRGDQLGILRAAVIPPGCGSGKDKGTVSPATLKHVLRAIDDHGGGGEAFLGYATIAKETGHSVRQVTRAVDWLKELSLLCVERRRTPRGPVCNHYWIVWNELALLGKPNLPGALTHANRADNSLEPATVDPGSAIGEKQPAIEEKQPAIPREESAISNSQSAIGGKRNVQETSEEAQSEAPSDVWEDGAMDAIREKANRFGRFVDVLRSDNRKLVAKTAILWQRGQFSDDMMEQVLESFRVKRETRERIEKPGGWLWTTLLNQCEQHGLNLGKLLRA